MTHLSRVVEMRKLLKRKSCLLVQLLFLQENKADISITRYAIDLINEKLVTL